MTKTPHTITATDRRLADVVRQAYVHNFTVQSDFSRMHADYVAMAASLGLLSTKVVRNVFSREWRPTVKGLRWIERVFGDEIEIASDLDHGQNAG